KGPLAAQIKAAHDPGEELRRQGRTVLLAAGFHEHRRRFGMGLHVVDVVAQSFEAQQVLHRPPDGARYRDPAHHAQKHNLWLENDVQPCFSEAGASRLFGPGAKPKQSIMESLIHAHALPPYHYRSPWPGPGGACGPCVWFACHKAVCRARCGAAVARASPAPPADLAPTPGSRLTCGWSKAGARS